MEETTDGMPRRNQGASGREIYRGAGVGPGAQESRGKPDCGTERVDGVAQVTLQDLPHLSRDQLGHLWREFLGIPVPKSLSLPLMLRFVAFEMQARAQGGLPAGFTDRLAGRVAEAGRTRAVPARLRPGGRLLREWNGTTHVVDIVEGGFVWQGATHASLSAIAKEITGAHWSGPRFFGLTGGKAGAGGAAKGGAAKDRTVKDVGEKGQPLKREVARRKACAEGAAKDGTACADRSGSAAFKPPLKAASKVVRGRGTDPAADAAPALPAAGAAPSGRRIAGGRA